MARQTDDLREWVSHRWADFFVARVREIEKAGLTKERLYLAPPTPGDTLDYRGCLAVPRIAEIVDRTSKRTAERSIHRWLDRTRVPEPDQVRTTLSALRVNWIAGLARAGYQQHAIYLLHGLWKNGAQSLALSTARLAFFDSHLATSDDSSEAWVLSAKDLDRLELAAQSCWPTTDELPRGASLTNSDFLVSKDLFAAYALLDAALNMRYDVGVKRRIYAIQDAVARHVKSWIETALKGVAA